MQTPSIGIGVIGCGGMGRSILRRVLAIDPRFRVMGLCDPDARSIATTSELIGYKPPVVDDYRALCAAPDVDWVMIASWNCQHREHTLAAFEAGKHVFCQKPLATTLDDCVAMVEAQQRSGKLFNIGFTLRYSPHYRKLKSLLDEGIVGRIVSMEFNETLGFNHGGYIMGDWRRLRENAGTHLLEKCCHDIDLANWMIDSVPRRVASFGGRDIFTPENVHQIDRIGPDKHGNAAFQGWPGLIRENPFTADKDIVDNQVAIIEYGNGVRATFHTNMCAGICERRMYILGTEGAIRADVLDGSIQVQRVGHDEPIIDESTEASGGHGGGDDVLAAELADSMLNGSVPKVGVQEGLKSAIACFAIDDAMDSGQVVDLASYWKRAGIELR
ncbi:MAG: Gfo/Idh/MocA family oxidoreductase [Verrucomicrobia bacterium]|nr:Gfo/Idh/MocA family oxidoreductase [Verrucomicrobiota bacterium]